MACAGERLPTVECMRTLCQPSTTTVVITSLPSITAMWPVSPSASTRSRSTGRAISGSAAAWLTSPDNVRRSRVSESKLHFGLVWSLVGIGILVLLVGIDQPLVCSSSRPASPGR